MEFDNFKIDEVYEDDEIVLIKSSCPVADKTLVKTDVGVKDATGDIVDIINIKTALV